MEHESDLSERADGNAEIGSADRTRNGRHRMDRLKQRHREERRGASDAEGAAQKSDARTVKSIHNSSR